MRIVVGFLCAAPPPLDRVPSLRDLFGDHGRLTIARDGRHARDRSRAIHVRSGWCEVLEYMILDDNDITDDGVLAMAAAVKT
eukprot:5546333-Prymnesium_polylepis.1